MLRTLLLGLPVLAISLAWAVEHPALPSSLAQSQLPALKTRLAPLMALPEADLLELVPEQNGLYFVGCVNCGAGMQEGQLSVWDWKTPDQIRCKYCGQVYPSEKYPATGVTEAKAPNGALVRYPYYVSSPSWWTGKEPYRSYFQARIDYEKLHFMERLASDLARVYALSGETAYARRAALIIARFAQVYPGYCFHYDYPFQQKVIHDGTVPASDFRPGYRTARWSWWAYMDISRYLLEAYDLVAPSGELAQLSAEQKTDVPAQVEGMFTAMADQVLGNRDDLSNMSPGMWADLIAAGRVLGKPECVHIPVSRLRRMMTEMFFYDGSWQEGAPSYHSQVIGNVQGVLQVARGYSDPLGYKAPATGERFDDLDLEKQLPEVARAKAALDRMRLPNGRYIPVHDTWSINGGAALEESKPDLLGGLGQGILGFGKGADQFQADMTWSPGYGHIHYDGLSLLLFAKGKELLSDVGYTHTRAREWTIQSPAHNLVVVDDANQVANHDTLGNLRYFATPPDVQMMSVDNPQVYPGVTSLYRRTVALVKLSDTDGYVVDVFRVTGGKQHDYFLHGSADDPQTLTVNSQAPLEPLPTLVPPGVAFTPAASEGQFHEQPGQAYGYFRDLKRCSPGADTLLDMDFQTEKSAAGLRVFTLAKAGDEFVTGTNPSIRGAGSDDSKLDQFKRQFMMLRRQGGDSLFVSILAPYGERRVVQGAKLVDIPGGVAIEVNSGGRLDLVVVADKPVQGQWQGQELQTEAELTVIETVDGKPICSTAIGGSFRFGGTHLNNMAVMEGKLLGVERAGGTGTLLLDEGFLPSPGDVIVVDHAGKRSSPYAVKSAKREGRQVRVELAEDPGFDYDAATETSKFVFLPRENYTGKHVVRHYPVAQVSFTKHE